MSLIWATRGRAWGFRFIRTAGESDPLPVYEEAFSGIGDEPEVWRRVNTTVAMRFRDPNGRKDQSGRFILHEFVLRGDTSEGVNSAQEGRERIWPLVSEEYERVYDLPAPPTSHE